MIHTKQLHFTNNCSSGHPYSHMGGKAITIVIILLFLAISAGIAFGVVYYINKDKNKIKKTPLTNIELREELYDFCYAQLPVIFQDLLKFDTQIRLIDNELDRLTNLESTFPKHKMMIVTEKNEWIKLKKRLLATFTSFTRELEIVCVQYKVNEEKGNELIQQQKENLQKMLEDAVEESKKVTQRITPPPAPKTFTQKILDKFS